MSGWSSGRTAFGPDFRWSALHLLAVIAVCAVLWVPFVQWIGSPDRDTLLTNAGRFLVVSTACVQVVVIVLAVLLLLAAATWTEEGARTGSLVMGWIGFVAAPGWAYCVAFSYIDWFDVGVDDRVVFLVICALLAVPAVVRLSAVRLRVALGVTATTGLLAATALLAIPSASVLLLAPATAYSAAMVVSGACARHARG
ncbi:hypothetical protein B7R21_15435 [Subtercola boreus]|uniref:Uncharacterized protein n=1 Tax=Subtercola boreus TaxID=120213 RepID=A0A3E0VFE0_9MICO|nr:hypothetical protein [Subtercola boreus]RFA07577.1 hypothetical protein B7R21_15435 [Subtercola boreus]